MARRNIGRTDHSAGQRFRTLWIIGMAVLGLLVLVLVYVALTQNRTSPVAGTVPTPASSAPVDRATPTVEPTAEPVVVVGPPTRNLGAVDGERGYRASVTACPGDEPIVQATEDGGSSWTDFAVAVDPAVASVRAILPGTGDYVALVTADAATCAPQFARSYVAGEQWESADEVDTTWHLSQDATSVIAPGGGSSQPCEKPVQVAATSQTAAAVLCADGAIVTSTDAGGSWSAPLSIPGASAIGGADDGYLVVVARQNDCDGAQIASIPADGGTDAPEPSACLQSGAAPQDNAVAQGGDVIWLWSGDAFARSTDGGQSW
ncbi:MULTISPECIES: hypothetical protein [unclassified Leifsonia]|uniref:hypothetical protein n=1 Tax=unclassified Leifsonia TaxID=2663824 RepID=UPI0006FA1CB1|nr:MULTISPECIES: hypothetical protein [unclassified Leifsonia]KQX05658.1 hypothetical protein ASC59_16430 [Leifsonia sp. Root1293]KRA09294.1 hypothetical protein ASD61_16425 [Leifsonia sp. Root60]